MSELLNNSSEQEQTKSEGEKTKELEGKFYPEDEKKNDEKSQDVSDNNEKEGEGDSDTSNEAQESDENKEDSKEQETDGKPEGFEKSDLRLPEESIIDDEGLEGIVNFAKEQGLSKEQAQALLDRENKTFGDHLQKQQDQLREQGELWMQEMQEDKTFGGDNLKENAELARRALNKFGDDKFLEDIQKANLGNHPGLSRMLMRIGRAMGEDSLIKGDTPKKKKTYEELFYGEN